MSFFNPCFFCLKTKENQNHMLCQRCVILFAEYKFYCCPRCSKFDCSGCTNLSEFNSIFAIYSYNSIISKIIAGAKDKFNMHFQEIFEEIFFLPVKHELAQILSHKDYHLIILSPYRKSRMFHGFWHPNLFFEKIFLELKKDFHFEILTPHYRNYKSNTVCFPRNFLNKSSFENILLCDDVLTTGTSALKSFHAINKNFETSHIKNWDLFTIFRSPQK